MERRANDKICQKNNYYNQLPQNTYLQAAHTLNIGNKGQEKNSNKKEDKVNNKPIHFNENLKRNTIDKVDLRTPINRKREENNLDTKSIMNEGNITNEEQILEQHFSQDTPIKGIHRIPRISQLLKENLIKHLVNFQKDILKEARLYIDSKGNIKLQKLQQVMEEPPYNLIPLYFFVLLNNLNFPGFKSFSSDISLELFTNEIKKIVEFYELPLQSKFDWENNKNLTIYEIKNSKEEFKNYFEQVKQNELNYFYLSLIDYLGIDGVDNLFSKHLTMNQLRKKLNDIDFPPNSSNGFICFYKLYNNEGNLNLPKIKENIIQALFNNLLKDIKIELLQKLNDFSEKINYKYNEFLIKIKSCQFSNDEKLQLLLQNMRREYFHSCLREKFQFELSYEELKMINPYLGNRQYISLENFVLLLKSVKYIEPLILKTLFSPKVDLSLAQNEWEEFIDNQLAFSSNCEDSFNLLMANENSYFINLNYAYLNNLKEDKYFILENLDRDTSTNTFYLQKFIDECLIQIKSPIIRSVKKFENSELYSQLFKIPTLENHITELIGKNTESFIRSIYSKEEKLIFSFCYCYLERLCEENKFKNFHEELKTIKNLGKFTSEAWTCVFEKHTKLVSVDNKKKFLFYLFIFSKHYEESIAKVFLDILIYNLGRINFTNGTSDFQTFVEKQLKPIGLIQYIQKKKYTHQLKYFLNYLICTTFNVTLDWKEFSNKHSSTYNVVEENIQSRLSKEITLDGVLLLFKKFLKNQSFTYWIISEKVYCIYQCSSMDQTIKIPKYEQTFENVSNANLENGSKSDTLHENPTNIHCSNEENPLNSGQSTNSESFNSASQSSCPPIKHFIIDSYSEASFKENKFNK